MHIGFTGTQKGMTDFQKKEVAMILLFHKPFFIVKDDKPSSITFENYQAHHGDCIGADAEFEQLAKEYGFTTCAHPASDTGNKRAYCKSDIVLPAKPALKRNKDIVDTADVMIATPGQKGEVLRSGTWATIRYARKCGTPIHIIYPKELTA